MHLGVLKFLTLFLRFVSYPWHVLVAKASSYSHGYQQKSPLSPEFTMQTMFFTNYSIQFQLQDSCQICPPLLYFKISSISSCPHLTSPKANLNSRLEFWNSRHSTLSDLIFILSTPFVSKIFRTYPNTDHTLLIIFLQNFILWLHGTLSSSHLHLPWQFLFLQLYTLNLLVHVLSLTKIKAICYFRVLVFSTLYLSLSILQLCTPLYQRHQILPCTWSTL